MRERASMEADGTAEPAPPPDFADPLSGFGVGDGGGASEAEPPPPVGPVTPDPEMVRQMVHAAMAADDGSAPELRAAVDQVLPADPPTASEQTSPVIPIQPIGPRPGEQSAGDGGDSGSAGQQGAEPLGMLPQQRRTWPIRPHLMRRGLRRRPPARAVDAPAEDVETEAAEQEVARQPVRAVLPKPSSGSAGVVVAIVLMLVFGIVAIQMLSSLIESITSIFE